MTDNVDVLLDVDGVLNALGRTGAWGWTNDDIVKVMGFQIRYSSDMVERLNALSGREHVNFHWLTTWEDEAPSQLVPVIGLDGAQWPVLPRPAQKFSDYRWWKLLAAEEHVLNTDHRVVWVDDDLYEQEARDFAAQFGERRDLISSSEVSYYGTPDYFVASYGDRILLVRPDTNIGLSREMVETMEEWIG